MATNQAALDKIHIATLKLVDAWGAAKSNAAANKIVRLLQIVDREYHALLHIDPGSMNDRYKVITDEFKGSKAQIKGIIDDRDQLIKDITIAKSIANALGPLLAFL